MGRADVGSGKNSPRHIIPQLVQVSKDNVNSSPNKLIAVFHERDDGSNFASDSGKLRPESGTLSVDSSAQSSAGDVLAGKSAAEDESVADGVTVVDEVSGVGIVASERPDVVPKREVRKASVSLS